eukprot:1143871-Pelagomonas_calceolata.AAC.2
MVLTSPIRSDNHPARRPANPATCTGYARMRMASGEMNAHKDMQKYFEIRAKSIRFKGKLHPEQGQVASGTGASSIRRTADVRSYATPHCLCLGSCSMSDRKDNPERRSLSSLVLHCTPASESTFSKSGGVSQYTCMQQALDARTSSI